MAQRWRSRSVERVAALCALAVAAVVAWLALQPPVPAARSVEVSLPKPLVEVTAVGPEATAPEEPAPPPVAVPPAVQAAPVPPAPPPGEPAWRRNAVATGPEDGKPMIAIVIDDMGLDRRRTEAALALPAPLTISFMTYAEDLASQAGVARRHGHEIMLHVPMEPLASHVDPGPNALRVDLDDAELHRRLAWDLGRLDGVVGANNHMGSRFTESVPGMTLVVDALNQRGLFFLDSRTSPRTVGAEVARQRGVPHVARDVFLDDVANVTAIDGQLAQTEAVARRKGTAIAIGHPYESTIEALSRWLRTAPGDGFRLVPVSAIVAHDQALQTHAAAAGRSSE